MSLEHAILGFLTYHPLSGYDLKKVFDETVRHFWPATQSQIYRTLSRMAHEGLVRVEKVEQEDRPDRKVYHITDTGRQELRRWLLTPLPPRKVREPELIQVFFAGQLTDAEIIQRLEHAAERLHALLQYYRQLPQEPEAYVEQAGSPREAFFWVLTLEHGIAMTRAELEWLQSVIQRLKNKDQPP